MHKITKIETDDGNCFNTEIQAKRYVESEYGKRLSSIVNKIIQTEYKLIPLHECIENNLDLFKDLVEWKKELDDGLEEDEY